MKVIDNRFDGKEIFYNIEVGEFFEYEHECYIKISDCWGYCFDTEDELEFSNNVLVNKIKVELHIVG